MKCNIIAHRIAIQEYLQSREEPISKRVQELLDEEDKTKFPERRDVEQMMEEWLEDFRLA